MGASKILCKVGILFAIIKAKLCTITHCAKMNEIKRAFIQNIQPVTYSRPKRTANTPKHFDYAEFLLPFRRLQ